MAEDADMRNEIMEKADSNKTRATKMLGSG
nr:synaptosomal-associated 25K protein - rat (fragments) [Rattus norvegicus]